MAKNRYKELIFTHHALERLKSRNITMSQAWAVWRRPNKRSYAKTKQAWVFCRNWHDMQIEVVAKQNEKKEWVVLSVWSNRISSHKPRQSFWKKMIVKIWKQLF